MQDLVVRESIAREGTSMRSIERLDTRWVSSNCSCAANFSKEISIGPTCRLGLPTPPSSISIPSSSFQISSPLRRNVVLSRRRSRSLRVLCEQDEGVTKSELKELAKIVLNEAGVESSTKKNENFGNTSSLATGTYPRRHPLDLRRISAWADSLTERGMRKRRTFYSQDDWVRHRSSTRHYRHFKSSFSSRAILSLIPPVGTMTAISVAVSLYNSIVLTGWLPSFIPLLHSSSLPYQLTAPALALLLVFRTEASYSRYDEARKTWTKVISSSKDMARQLTAWVQCVSDNQHKKLLLDYILAFPVALKCHLLYESDIAEELTDILEEDDLALVLRSEHRPNCLLQLMTHSLKCVQVEESERSSLDTNISQFNESISVCERLIRTPIPLSYTRLTSRFLVLWHLTLPVVLWDDCHWMVVPATFISAASLFCIEEVGVLIEEPFPILALDRMCAKARENIQELADLQVQAQDHLDNKTKKTRNQDVTNGVTMSSSERK